MDNLKASIIIPVYQAEKYIRRCLDSVVNQTYKEFEVVIIDDGSTDRSGAICDEYAAKDKRIRVFHQKNKGVTAARYAGMKNAIGEYLFWVDADDYADIYLLEKAVQVIEKKQVDIVAWSTITYVHGKETERTIWKEQTLSQWRRDAVLSKCSVLWMFCAKKRLWDQVNYPMNMAHAAEDGDIAMQLFMHAQKVGVVSDPLYYYQDDTPHSVTHGKSSFWYFDNYQLWRNRLKVCEKEYPDSIDYCAQRALSCAVKSYCLDLVLGDMTKDNKNEIIGFLKRAKNITISGRQKEKFLSWAIRHKYDWICEIYVRHKLKNTK
mgnify:FL=1|jgi:glycosyltransferase involved in cell wall biosynthesis